MSYKKLSERLYSQSFLIGSCIRQRSAQTLANFGSAQAVRLLATAVVDSKDRQVIAIALNSLRNLHRQDSIDAFCQIWADTRNKDLEKILRSQKYVSTQPNLRILSALKVESFDIVTKCDVEGLEPLLLALIDKDSQIASNAANCVVRLENSKTIDEICNQWASSRNAQLEEIIQQGNYIANEPKYVRVLTALKFNHYKMILEEETKFLDLLLVAINDMDYKIQEGANSCISQLKNRKTIDILCKKWMGEQSYTLKLIIQKSNYEPSELIAKVVFYFLLGEWQKYEDLDFDGRLLDKGYKTFGKNIANQIVEKAKTSGRIEWIKFLTEPKYEVSIKYMTDSDWEKTIEILVTRQDKKEICKFLVAAPPRWSVRLLLELENLRQNEELFNLPGQENWFTVIEELLMLPKNTNLSLLAKNSNFELPYISVKDTEDKENCESCYNSYSLNYGSTRLDSTIDNNKEIEVSASGSSITLSTLRNKDKVKILESHRSDITSLNISPDGTVLVSESSDGVINLWSLPDGIYIKTLDTDSFSPDSSNPYYTHIFATSLDSTVLILNSTKVDWIDHDLYNGMYGAYRFYSIPDGTYLKAIKLSRCYFFDLYDDSEKLYIKENGGKNIVEITIYPPLDMPIKDLSFNQIKQIECVVKDEKSEQWSLGDSYVEDSGVSEMIHNAYRYSLAIHNSTKQFDIDIEEATESSTLSLFDIEIDL
jgi:WD40 repeat protein